MAKKKPKSVVFRSQSRTRAAKKLRAQARPSKALPPLGAPSYGPARFGTNPAPAPRTDKYGRIKSPVLPFPKKALPKPKKKIKSPAGVQGPIKLNVRPPKKPAASGSSGTAATTPPHATTGAVAPRSLGAPTAAAVARSTPTRTTTTTTTTAKTKTLTDAELVAQQLDPLYLENQQALDAARRAEAQREALIKSLTTGLQGDLGQVAGQVQGDYDRAFAATTGLASAGQQAIAAGAPTQNAQMEADLRAIGAPQEQIDALKAKNQAIYGGGAATIFGREGVLPGTDLASQGAAASAYARSLPGIAGMQGQAQLTAVIRAAQENEQKLADQRAVIAAKAPQILQSIQESRLSQAAKNRALDMEAASLGLKISSTKFNQGVAKAKLGLEQGRLNLSALQADRSWQATLKRLGISEANLKLKAAQLEQKRRTGGFTASQVAHLKSDAYSIADHAKHGFDQTDSKGNVIATHRPLTYGEAIREMLKAGVPLAIARPALNLYYKPNQRKVKAPAPAGARGPIG